MAKRNSSFISSDGRVVAKSGDTISGFCAKLYGISPNDTKRYWTEFERVKNGRQTKISDPNRISIGEVLVHVPTQRSHQQYGSTNEDIVVSAEAWPQMRFRLSGTFAKAAASFGLGAMWFNGRVQVKFSDDEYVYQWGQTNILFLIVGLPRLPWKGHGVGALGTLWSDPVEFKVHSFDPREYWKKVNPGIEVVLSSAWSLKKARLILKWALPKDNSVKRKTGSNSSYHLSKQMSFDTLSVNMFPDFEHSFGSGGNLTGFHKTKLRLKQ